MGNKHPNQFQSAYGLNQHCKHLVHYVHGVLYDTWLPSRVKCTTISFFDKKFSVKRILLYFAINSNFKHHCVLRSNTISKTWLSHLHVAIFWAHKISLAPSLFIEVLVPNEESEQSGISVLEVSILPPLRFFYWISEVFWRSPPYL